MGMFDEVRSVPKPMSHQKEKDKPDYHERRYNRKRKRKKKVEMVNGVKIPSRKIRSEFTMKQKQQIIEMYGGEVACAYCGYYLVEFHHCKFRSKLGRNNPRNGVPLCRTCHERCHTEHDFAELWRIQHKLKHGDFYWMDKYDLWKLGKIERPKEELLEKFFETQYKNG